MSNCIPTGDLYALEALVDKHGLQSILEMLSEICDGKSTHLLCNWQDKDAAKTWSQDARKIDSIASKVNNR